jgi:hypothetical protein
MHATMKILFTSLALSVVACGASEPNLRYTPEQLARAEILTSGRLRVTNQPLFIELGQQGLEGREAEQALIARLAPTTAVRLDDATIWYPPTRIAIEGCEVLDSFAEFETCVLDRQELNSLDPNHRVWSLRYATALGADITAYAVEAQVIEADETCEVEPNPDYEDRPPYPTPEVFLDPTEVDDTQLSSQCPCTRKLIAQGRAYKQTEPESWYKYRNRASGEVKWSKTSGGVGGEWESTGQHVNRDWTRETVTCKGFYHDTGNMERMWLSPCRLWGGPCKDCADISSTTNYVSDALSKLYTFNAESGEFVVREFADPCQADGATIGQPVTW